jgi:hypothetical protein
MAFGPAGAASSRSRRLAANTAIASASARSRSAEQFALEVQRDLGLEGEARGVGQPLVGLAVLQTDAEALHDEALAALGRVGSVSGRPSSLSGVRHAEEAVDEAFLLGAEDRQRAVARHAAQRLVVAEVVAVALRLGIGLLVLPDLGDDQRFVGEPLAQVAEQRRVFGELLHEDEARPLEGRRRIGDALLGRHERSRERMRILRRIGEQQVLASGSRPASRAIIALVRRFFT